MTVDNPKTKVLILWGIVLSSFVVFWICHTNISNYQNFIEPRNYLVRAEYYFQNGNRDKALHEIDFGINAFKPVSPEALDFFIKIKKDSLDKIEYNELQKKYQVVAFLENCAHSENLQLDTNILNTSGIFFPSLSKTTQASVLSMWKLLTRSTLKCMQNVNLSGKQILNFLYYSGGIFCLNSKIGDTGFTIDDDVLVVSEGSEAGSGAQIWFQGRNFGGHRRGFYVLILTPPPCKMYRSDRFDVWDDYNESVKMTRFLEEVPEGYIGIFAVADEASENMTEELEQMLLSFGFAQKTYVRRELKLFGYGYAFAGIGVKGAGGGTAIQNWAEYDPSRKEIPLAVCGVMKGENKQ